MTATQIMHEINFLPPAEQAKVILDEVKLKAFAQTLIQIQQRLQLLVNLPPEKLAATALQSTARALAQA